MNDNQPARGFQGVWIPREIWDSEQLTLNEKCLLAEIKFLEDPARGGCFASNIYLGEVFKTSSKTIANRLTKLRRLRWIETIDYDGRNRLIRVLKYGGTHFPKSGNRTSRNPGIGLPEIRESEPALILGDIKDDLKLDNSNLGVPPEGIEIPSGSEAQKPANCAQDMDWALRIFDLYPRKVGKKAAIKAILKQVKEHGGEKVFERTQLHAGVLQVKIKYDGTDSYVKHPATFFNQEIFLEEPEAPKAPFQPNRDTLLRQLQKEAMDLENEIEVARGRSRSQERDDLIETLKRRRQEIAAKRRELMSQS